MFFTEIAVFCVRKVASFEVIVLRLLCPEMTLVKIDNLCGSQDSIYFT